MQSCWQTKQLLLKLQHNLLWNDKVLWEKKTVTKWCCYGWSGKQCSLVHYKGNVLVAKKAPFFKTVPKGHCAGWCPSVDITWFTQALPSMPAWICITRQRFTCKCVILANDAVTMLAYIKLMHGYWSQTSVMPINYIWWALVHKQNQCFMV